MMGEKTPQRSHVPRNSGSYGTWMLRRYYLLRRKRAFDAACPYCQHTMGTAEYIIFDCPLWESMRLTVNGFIGNRKVTPSNVQNLLCGPTNVPIYIKDRIQAASQRATQTFYEMVEAYFSARNRMRG